MYLVGYPTTGSAGCCARATCGHIAAAPPSATSNSRRPIVTVIRPSRVRCVNGTIPRRESAVFTFEEAGSEMARRRRKGAFTDAEWAAWEHELVAAGREGRMLGALSLDGR